MDRELSEEALQDLYAWIDDIPLSRPKKHITRDFSDGVMAAEVVKHFFPKLVELHNYSPASSTKQKLSNWSILNRKVFSKLNFHVSEEAVKRIVFSVPGGVEPVLFSLREKMDLKLDQNGENILDFGYYDIKNKEKLPPGTRQLETRVQAQLKAVDGRRIHEKIQANNSHPRTLEQFTPEIEPAVRLALQEKEQALMALKETVEILQMKVTRLEHLLHLKDMRIEDLTRHMEMYKGKARANNTQ